MIISIGKKKSNKPSKTKVKLDQHIIKEQQSYLSYISNNTDCIYNGELLKTKTGYIGKISESIIYPIESEILNTYSYDNGNYSYIDKDGYKRIFNKLDTLKFDEESNTYFGTITEVNYKDTKIEIFEEE